MKESWTYRRLAYPGWKKRVGPLKEARFFPSIKVSGNGFQTSAFGVSATELFRKTDTRAVLLSRSGQTPRVWEAQPGDVDTPFRLFSVTKSLFTLLWAALRLDTSLPEGVPLSELGLPFRHPVPPELTVEHLWRMANGIRFHESFRWGSEQVRTFLHPHSRRTILDARFDYPVGERFHYNDYHTLLLGLILERALGGSWGSEEPVVVKAWRERLWEPWGVVDPCWWILDSKRWRFPKTESGLVMSARSLAGLGKLILAQGLHEGRPLWDHPWLVQGWDRTQAWHRPQDFARVPGAWGAWLREGKAWYGRHWWGLERRGEEAIFALGIHGQVLLLRPAISGVAVRLGNRWGGEHLWPEELFDLLDDQALVE
ncbi:MAG: serine hydrolase [Spirochaetales bacterium]|nr:serine hydrolase [Spirochaetales bacterium]